MHPAEVRAQVRRLIEAGVNDCEVSRRTGVARSTVKDIRSPRYVRTTSDVLCPRCYGRSKPITFTPADYCELLGYYLGDGHITEMARSQRLRVSLDAKYPKVIAELVELLRRSFPANRLGSHRQHEGTMAVVWIYSKHLGCLFPQHGAGPKHSRPIELEEWQQRLVRDEPWALIKGLIWTDGCRFVNRTGPHEYPSYAFSNCSEGIVDVLLEASRRVGLKPRVTFELRRRMWHVRFNRRRCAALLDEHVGGKV